MHASESLNLIYVARKMPCVIGSELDWLRAGICESFTVLGVDALF